MMRRLCIATFWIALAFLIPACGDGEGATSRDHATFGAPGGATSDSAHIDALAPRAGNRVSAAPVSLWNGPGGQPFDVALRTADPASAHARKFGAITMQTALRTRAPNLEQYPCTSCHLGRRLILAEERVADAHRNITAAHPAQTGSLCSTCHAPDNVELLALENGERATLDHAYQACAQCHVSQAEAWAGGAHGKRLDGWQGPRVLMGCADCHDPHDPTLEPRIPFRAPQLQRIRGPDQ
jgi:hypothetical protein